MNTSPSAPLSQDVTLATFMAEVIDASKDKLVIVDFWAPWCGPCKQLLPLLEKTVASYKGAVRLAKINIDKEPEIAQQMRVQSVPAVFAFFRGQPVDGFMGGVPEAQLKSWIDRLVKAVGAEAKPDEGEAALLAMMDAAQEALLSGDAQNAHALFQEILSHLPENVAAYAGAIKALLALGEREAAQKMYDLATPEMLKDKAMEGLAAALDLAREAQDTSTDIAELLARIEKNPQDHAARLDLAMAHFAQGAREAAVDALLESIRLDRKANDEAARKQLVKLLEAFGFTDPLAVETRRKLSAILFS